MSTISNYTGKWDAIDKASTSPELDKFRTESREKLLSTLYPTRRVEEWKYTNVSRLADATFSAPSSQVLSSDIKSEFEDAGFYDLFIINGAVDADSLALVNKVDGVTVSGLETGVIANLDGFSNLSTSLETKYDTPFVELNNSMLQEGLIIEVAKKAILDRPIRLNHISILESANTTTQPRIVIKVGEQAQASVVELYTSKGEFSSFTNVVTDIEVKPAARLSHAKVVDESSEITHISSTRVRLERDATFNDLNGCYAGGIVRQDLNVILDGENSEANLNGIYVGSEEDHFDNHLNVIHRKPHARSSQAYKGVMGDKSRAVFNGKIIIERYAQKSDAAQINKNLLLSDTAEVDTKPELWVDADDVKAAHGATVSQLDENEIFYFQTRGITRSKAEAMLARGFVEEIIYNENDSKVRAFVEGYLSKSFPSVK